MIQLKNMDNILVFSKSNLLGDKNFIVIGKKDDFITFFRLKKITDRKYKTFKNIVVIYREDI